MSHLSSIFEIAGFPRKKLELDESPIGRTSAFLAALLKD
jgi:hypothetical protein